MTVAAGLTLAAAIAGCGDGVGGPCSGNAAYCGPAFDFSAVPPAGDGGAP